MKASKETRKKLLRMVNHFIRNTPPCVAWMIGGRADMLAMANRLELADLGFEIGAYGWVRPFKAEVCG